MSNPLVTVIIPAYNTEKYIGEMLDCVVNQTYKNLQIIIIDDGSTDGTSSVVEKIIDDRIEVIKVSNGGVSRARNIGIERAKGEKIFFWDSDDIIELDAIEEIISYAEEKNVKAVLYGYSYYKDGMKGKPFPHEIQGIYRGTDKILNDLMPHFLGYSYNDVNNWILGKTELHKGKENTALWRVMLNAKTVKDNNLLFDTKLSLGEDTKFINLYLCYESSIGFLDKCFYYLRERTNGANLTSVNNPVLAAQNKIKLIYARKEIDSVCSKKGYDTSRYWSGTVVFSAVELAVKLSHNKKVSVKENKKMFYEYMKLDEVKSSINGFKPMFRIKAIPFIVIRFPKVCWNMCKVIPSVFTSRFI